MRSILFGCVGVAVVSLLVSCGREVVGEDGESRVIAGGEPPIHVSEMERMSQPLFENADQARRVHLILRLSKEIDSSLFLLKMMVSKQRSVEGAYVISPELSAEITDLQSALFALRTRYTVEVFAHSKRGGDAVLLNANAFEAEYDGLVARRDAVWVRFVEDNGIEGPYRDLYPIVVN